MSISTTDTPAQRVVNHVVHNPATEAESVVSHLQSVAQQIEFAGPDAELALGAAQGLYDDPTDARAFDAWSTLLALRAKIREIQSAYEAAEEALMTVAPIRLAHSKAA